MDLNEYQESVVAAPLDKTLKVTAGAGTGKTRVLVERYVKLVTRDGVVPPRILALTFTRKAASEMRKRIFDRVAEEAPRRMYLSLYEASITNFHSFCYQVIKENPEHFILDPDVDVATEVDKMRVQELLYRKFEAGKLAGVPKTLASGGLTAPKLRDFFQKCLKMVDKCRGLMLGPQDLSEKIAEDDETGYRDHVEAVRAIWKGYEDELERRNLVDFPGLIYEVVRALKNNDAFRKAYANRYDAILVDEYQDTSEAQAELLYLLSGGHFSRVTVVGDDKQSIYRWRDARVENLREFTGETHPLSTNYRSVQEILDLAGSFIAKDEYYAGKSYRITAKRGKDEGAITVFHPLSSEDELEEEEVRALTAWMWNLVMEDDVEMADGGGGDKENDGEGGPDKSRGSRNPLGFGDFAVLLRSLRGPILTLLEREFTKRAIPYALVGTSASLEGGVLKTLRSMLSLLVWPDDVTSLLYLLEEEPFSLSDADLYKLFRTGKASVAAKAASQLTDEVGKSASKAADDAAKLATQSTDDATSKRSERKNDMALDVPALLSPEVLSALGEEQAKKRCAALSRTLEILKEKHASLDFSSFIWEALEASSVFFRLISCGAALETVDEVEKRIYEVVATLLAKSEANINSFLEYLDVLTDEETRTSLGEPHLPAGKVKIMTMHQAKGLEFHAVAVPGLKRKREDKPSFFVSRERGLFIDGYEERKPEKIEEARAYAESVSQEERCLLYVAMTRAKDRLFMSSSQPEGLDRRGKEGFFAEILQCLKDEGIPFRELREAPALANEGGTGRAQKEIASGTVEKVKRVRTTGRAQKRFRPTKPKGGQGVNTNHDEEETSGMMEEAARAWLMGRDRLEADAALPHPPLREIEPIDYRALMAFAACPLQYMFRYVQRSGEGLEEDHILERSSDEHDDGGVGEYNSAGKAGKTGESTGAEKTGKLTESGWIGESEIAKTGCLIPNLSAVEYGSFVHKILENVVLARNLKENNLKKEIKNAAIWFGFSKKQLLAAEKNVTPVISSFLKSEYGRPDGEVEVETPFCVRLDRLLFTGIIDRLDRVKSTYRIIDYKTGQKKNGKEENKEGAHTLAEHNYQVQYYAWALSKREKGKHIEGVLCYLRPDAPENVKVDTRSSTLSAIETSARGLEKALILKKFDAIPGPPCEECGYRKWCPEMAD